MVGWHVHNRVLRGRQYPGNFLFPLLPRQRSPKIIDPEEPAFQQVCAKSFHLGRQKPDRADVGRHDERAIEQVRHPLRRTTQWFGSASPLILTGVLVSSDSRIIKLMSAYG